MGTFFCCLLPCSAFLVVSEREKAAVLLDSPFRRRGHVDRAHDVKFGSYRGGGNKTLLREGVLPSFFAFGRFLSLAGTMSQKGFASRVS